MISTIQLSDRVKETLTTYKKSPRESYEEVILDLISEREKAKREKEELLKEGCVEMAQESLKIFKEWEHLDSEVESDWKW